jgi:hypothetical protein
MTSLIAFFVKVLVLVLRIAFLLLNLFVIGVLLIVCWPLSYFGIGFARRRNGGLELPVVTYRHPETNKTVILVGVMHIADRMYYERLQEMLDGLENRGTTIVYELIARLTEDEERALRPHERIYHKRTKEEKTERMTFMKLLVLSDQLKHLAYRPTWVRTDMRGFAFIKRFAKARLIRRQAEKRVKFLKSEKLLLRWFSNFLFMNMLAFQVFMRISTLYSRRARMRDRIIMHDRNLIGHRGIQAQNGDVAAIWGAAHLPGIGALLRKDGYVEIDRIWLCAYRFRKYSFRRAIGRIATATK